MYDDIPFDVYDDPDVEKDILSELYKVDHEPGPISAVSANYYLGRIKQNREKMTKYKEQAKQISDDFKARIETWLQSRQKTLDFDTQHCMDMLEAYYEQNKPANGKSLSLPEGNIGMYSVAAKYDFDTCKDDVLKFLQDHEELQKYIRNKPEINKAELKKACSVVDGKIYVGDLELPKVGFIPKTSEFGIR